MKKLHLKDSSFGHCIFSNNPLPPTSFSETIEWDRSPVTKETAHQTVYTDSHVHEAGDAIAWLIEPYDLIPDKYDYVRANLDRFKQVWTHDITILEHAKKPDHLHFVPLGGCWIDKQDQAIHLKTKQFSIIASGKQQLTGHRLRHSVVNAAGKHIDVFGNGYVPIDKKISGLKDYRYHFAIENCKRDFWFTEKLIDCFRTGTIPIYWGCPSINRFFNPDGMIIFNDLTDLKPQLKLCTPEFYDSKKEAIKENFERAKEFILAEDYISKHVLK